jgi:hypothetical protein
MLEAGSRHTFLAADRHEAEAAQGNMPHVPPLDIRASPHDIILRCGRGRRLVAALPAGSLPPAHWRTRMQLLLRARGPATTGQNPGDSRHRAALAGSAQERGLTPC